MAFMVAVLLAGSIIMLTLYFTTRYNPGVFRRRFRKDIYEYSDQQLLYALDNVVIKYHSIELNKLDGLLSKREPGMTALYWCDLTRLYAFSSENEVFKSFLETLSNSHWKCIIDAYEVFKLIQVRDVALDAYVSKDKLTLEQSEHFRYSIRDANGRMQEELCFYIRHNIDQLK